MLSVTNRQSQRKYCFVPGKKKKLDIIFPVFQIIMKDRVNKMLILHGKGKEINQNRYVLDESNGRNSYLISITGKINETEINIMRR